MFLWRLRLGFLHVLPAGAWCCVSPSALYTHDSQQLRIAELMDSSSGQPVNICCPDKMPGLQTQLWGGLGLIDSYSFACCLFFFYYYFLNLHLYVWACISVCVPVAAKDRNNGQSSRHPWASPASQYVCWEQNSGPPEEQQELNHLSRSTRWFYVLLLIFRAKRYQPPFNPNPTKKLCLSCGEM